MHTKRWPDLLGVQATIKPIEGLGAGLGAVCWIQGPIDHIVKLQLLAGATFSIVDASVPLLDPIALALGRIIAGHGAPSPVGITARSADSAVTITQLQAVTWAAGRRVMNTHVVEAGSARARLYEVGDRSRPVGWVDFENATTNDLILSAVGTLLLARRGDAGCSGKALL